MKLRLITCTERKDTDVDWLETETVTPTCSETEWHESIGSNVEKRFSVSILPGHQALVTVLPLVSSLSYSITGGGVEKIEVSRGILSVAGDEETIATIFAKGVNRT